MINLYYHSGSANHGCEAIVRSTAKLLKTRATLWSTVPDLDIAYGLNDIVDISEDAKRPLTGIRSLKFKVHHKLTGSDYLYTKYAHEDFFSSIKTGDICFSIGGDNYCYGGKEYLAHYNKIIHERGGKTVFWGCSFEPSEMDNVTARDIARYDLITARESISYETLKAVNPNTILVADPAFVLDSVELPLPEGWQEGNTIGINASPLIIQSAKDGKIAYEAYRKLISHILDATDATIVLIPHVVIEGNDDRIPLKQLYDEFNQDPRLILVDDHTAPQLKYIISKCSFFVGARTHATIAAYSTGVPTLVVGYSVKARGIARDLFGTEEGYVLPVQQLKESNELTRAFINLYEKRESIQTHLKTILPAYIAHADGARRALEELTKK